MEGDGVDGVDVLDAVLLQPVALEGVLLLLHLQAGVQVLHRHASFDGAQREALGTGNTALSEQSPFSEPSPFSELSLSGQTQPGSNKHDVNPL